MRVFILALALSAAAYASVIGGSSELNPVRTHPHRQSEDSVQQIIVKLRPSSAAAANVVARVRLTMRESRQIVDRMHVIRVEPATANETVAATVERLKADPDVEYAVPDERRYIHAVPNDSLYSTGGQWYL